MYLSKIELVGFKSFANKTAIDIHAGITAIVGPNGCGKSNIVDAIRWVLGEQKTSVLRSEKMENVIFNGSLSKKRLGFAEVSLTIQNTKNILPSEYSEVMISRRLFRSGDSEYLLNKQNCRLKDINNLLMDSGMGSDAYSVIELGMVEDLLDDRNDFRRRLFEEAAGITKYKVRRNESLRKLDATKQDLVRVLDNISEVERWVKGLKTQVNRAVRYKKLIDEIKEYEGTYYNAVRTRLQDEIKPHESTIRELENKISALTGDIAKGDAALEKTDREILEKQDTLRKTQEELNGIIQELRTTENTHATLQERNESLHRRQNRIQEEIAQFNAKITDVENQIQSIKESLQTSRRDMKDAEKGVDEIRLKRDKFLTSYKEKKSIYIGKNQQSYEVMNQLADKMRQRDSLGKVKEERATQLEKLRKTKRDTDSRLAGLTKTNSDLADQERALNEKSEKLRERRKNCIEQQKRISDLIVDIDKKINNQKVALESLRTKIDFLTTLVEEHGDLPGGVGEVLKAKNSLNGILGTVGELISVPKAYRSAVESALGEQAHYVVVDTWKNIQPAVEYLRRKKSGRVTFVALDRIPRTDGKNIAKPRHANIDSFDPLMTHISFPDNLRYLIGALLQDVFVVDQKNLAEFSIGIDQSVPCRIVNKIGEICSIGFIFSGGSVSEEVVGVIGRKDRIKELEKEAGEVKNSIGRYEKELDVQINEKEKLQDTIFELDEEIEITSKELESLRHKLGITEYEIKQAHDQIEQVLEETKQLELFMSDAAQTDALNYDIKVLEKVRDKLNVERETFQVEEEALEQERESIEDEFSEKNSFLSRFKEVFAGLEKEERRLFKFLDEYKKEIDTRKDQLEDAGINITATKNTLEELQEKLRDLFGQQKDFDDNVLSAREDLSELQDIRQSNYSNVRDLRKKFEEMKEVIQKNKDSLLEKRQELRFTEDILQQKEIEIRELREEDLEYKLDDLNKTIMDHRRKIENFGPVNLEALEEYNKERERLEFLQNQARDLEEAEKTLYDAIRKINKTARALFLQTYDRVCENFKEIFNSFFGSGIAELKIDDAVEPLESRIEIFAQPFGKKVQTISMLSAGEKTLTAIALLFAVYREKPSPFCIFDEVDAPLDDSNVSRYIRMLQQFSTDTQFIVVTHNKKTMEAAETLYGVTMEETGISKIVSVRLDRAEKLAEEVNP